MCTILKYSQYIRCVILVMPLFLVFMGIRHPDFTRPNKPKPMRRAVLDKTPVNKVLQSIVKVETIPCIINPPIFVIPTPEDYSPEVQEIHLPVPLLLQSPFPPRAPPALPSFA